MCIGASCNAREHSKAQQQPAFLASWTAEELQAGNGTYGHMGHRGICDIILLQGDGQAEAVLSMTG